DLLHHIHDLIAQCLHRDKPLIHQPEDQLGLTTPTSWIAVAIVLWTIEQPLLHQILRHKLPHFRAFFTSQPVITVEIHPKLINWCNNTETKLFRETKGLTTTAWSDMHNTGSLGCIGLFPGHHRMFDPFCYW